MFQTNDVEDTRARPLHDKPKKNSGLMLFALGLVDPSATNENAPNQPENSKPNNQKSQEESKTE